MTNQTELLFYAKIYKTMWQKEEKITPPRYEKNILQGAIAALNELIENNGSFSVINDWKNKEQNTNRYNMGGNLSLGMLQIWIERNMFKWRECYAIQN